MGMVRKPGRRPAAGVSLVELLVVVAVFALVIGATLSLLVQGVQGRDVSSERAELIESAQRASDQMADLLRAGQRFELISPQEVGVLALLDEDPENSTATNISYYVVSGKLVESVGGSSRTIAENVAGLFFRYFDRNGTEAVPNSEMTNIAQVEITLTLAKDGISESATSRVRLRNWPPPLF